MVDALHALAETVIGLYKTELIPQQKPWRNLEAVEFATLTRVDGFNNRRLLQSSADLPATGKEILYFQQLERSVEAA